jgi:competence protein ComEC
VLAGFALGIALDRFLAPPPRVRLALVAAAVVLTAWGLRRGLEDWGNSALALVLMALFGAFWHGARFRDRPPWHLSGLALDGRRLCYVRGEVLRPPEVHFQPAPFAAAPDGGRAYWMMRLEVTGLSGDGATWRPAAGEMALFMNAAPDPLEVGQRVEFLARPRTNRPPTNPGQRDASLAYERYGTSATASVSSTAALRVVGRRPWYLSPGAAAARVRSFVERGLARHLGGEGEAGRYGLVRALIFGRRSALTPRHERLLKESGTLHFLAISGLHVGLFCAFVEIALALLGLPVRLRSALTIGLIWAYVAFTGLHVSALRAGWVLTFLLAAPLLGRRRDAPSALAGAALLILLWSPQQLFAPGFQLTFVAVWGLVCIYPQLSGIIWPWEDFLARLQRPEERTLSGDLWLLTRSYLLLSLVAWAVTAPIRAYHFHSLCFVAPLLNVVVWPLVLALLLTCFALVASALLGGLGAAALAAVAGSLSDCVTEALRLAARLPGFGVYMASPPAWWVGLCLAVVALWAARRRLGSGRRLFLAGAAVLALGYFGHEFALRAGRSFRLILPDVGTGQAALVRLPEGQSLLFDAGSMQQDSREAVAELLWHERVGRINAIVVSHFNSDHCNFIPFLARRFRIQRVLVPHKGGRSPFQHRVRHWLRMREIPLIALSEGSVIGGGGLRCRALHPNALFIGETGLHENERSLVLQCEYGGLRFLLPGDIEDGAMGRLVRDYGAALRADLLVMPHEGHYHEALEEFLDAVRPVVAVVSGREEDCDPRTEALLAARGVPLWITGEEGAIILTMQGGRARLTGYATGRVLEFEPRAWAFPAAVPTDEGAP